MTDAHSTTSPTNPNTTPFLRSLAAGGIAGTTVDVSLFPIDTLKTRLQSSQGFWAAGGFRGVYAGIGSAVVGSAPGAALFFASYEYTKDYLHGRRSGPDGARPAALAGSPWAAALDHMLAATVGEVVACAVRVPTEVVKQRAQARAHHSSAQALREILATPGLAGKWREMYRGWGITVIREVPFTVIQFPLWEALKAWSVRQRGGGKATAGESAAYGAVSGVAAAGLTTPLDVLKTRMMLAAQKVPLGTLAAQIWRTEGPRAFFSGIGPRCGWIGAGGAVFLGAYQWAWNALEGVL